MPPADAGAYVNGPASRLGARVSIKDLDDAIFVRGAACANFAAGLDVARGLIATAAAGSALLVGDPADVRDGDFHAAGASARTAHPGYRALLRCRYSAEPAGPRGMRPAVEWRPDTCLCVEPTDVVHHGLRVRRGLAAIQPATATAGGRPIPPGHTRPPRPGDHVIVLPYRPGIWQLPEALPFRRKGTDG